MSPLNPLNPAAGEVPAPKDAREVQAAIRAASITWRIYPYFRWRYGNRGELFTRSDCGWLVTLTSLTQDRLQEQVNWLGSVLSNRGMPRLLLENRLVVLHRQLVRVVPSKREAYDKLLAASAQLTRERLERIPAGVFGSLVEEFSDSVAGRKSRFLQGVGELIVASVADEKSGIKNAVQRLQSWLIDPARFEQQAVQRYLSRYPEVWLKEAHVHAKWRDAVEVTIDRARAP